MSRTRRSDPCPPTPALAWWPSATCAVRSTHPWWRALADAGPTRGASRARRPHSCDSTHSRNWLSTSWRCRQMTPRTTFARVQALRKRNLMLDLKNPNSWRVLLRLCNRPRAMRFDASSSGGLNCSPSAAAEARGHGKFAALQQHLTGLFMARHLKVAVAVFEATRTGVKETMCATLPSMRQNGVLSELLPSDRVHFFPKPRKPIGGGAAAYGPAGVFKRAGRPADVDLL